MVLPREGGLYRSPPRPAEHRGPGYDEQFDNVTVFYDVFRCGRDIRTIGPPLFNLEPIVLDRLKLQGRSVQGRTTRLARAQRCLMPGGAHRAHVLAFDSGPLHLSADIGEDLASSFRNRRVLLTMSKDNSLQWVKDWARFYARAHGVDAVVIYDNRSTTYSLTDVAAALDEVAELQVGAVVDWPFEFGPRGVPGRMTPTGWQPGQWWDSDFCQSGALEHARWRLLRQAAGVINADVDELVVVPPKKTVFHYANLSPSGYVTYPGVWVEAVPYDPQPRSAYSTYGYVNQTSTPCPRKWCLVPWRLPARAQWRVHEVAGGWPFLHQSAVPRVNYRHFKGVTRKQRLQATDTEFDAQVHVVDTRVREVLHDTGL
jgi:hypothetical protein